MTAAIYCRLSKEDEEKNAESESIQNQKSMLMAYAAEQGWDIYAIYSDEDYSGADSERPGFCQLIAAASQRQFDIVLVKTQSRFTRDMELVEHYIHGRFVEWGIRFVAVVDHIDTAQRGNKKARQISGLINEWYLEDLSDNIRAVLDHKRRQGQYVGSFPLYGYARSADDKHKLVVDPPAAAVVQSIFSLYLSGYGAQQIARQLNTAAIPNPTAYKQAQGLRYVNGSPACVPGLWNRTTVNRILHERTYTGDLVQGRRRKLSYKSKKMLPCAPKDWAVVENAHEPIIDKATFTAVAQRLGQHVQSGGTGQPHLLAGKVRCRDCGSALVKVRTRYQDHYNEYLRCKLYLQDSTRCTKHAIRLDALEQQVLSRLKTHVGENYCLPPVSDRAPAWGPAARDQEIDRLEGEITRREHALRTLYLDRAQGLLDEARFHTWYDSFEAEQAALQEQLHKLRTNAPPGCAPLSSNWWDCPEHTRALIAALVDTVLVGQRQQDGRQQVDILWNF